MDNNVFSSDLVEIISSLNEKMKDVNEEFVCQFNIEGEGAITLDLSAKGDKLVPGVAENPEVQVDMSLKTLKNMLSGKLNPMVAYSTRKIKLKGDMQKVLKLVSVLGS